MPESAVDISSTLSELSALSPERPAVVSRGRSLSFAGLEAETGLLAAGLKALGVSAGTRVALLVPPGPEFYALTFALLRLGAVPVLVDPGLGLAGVGECLERSAPEVFIGSPKAHLARVLGRWLPAGVKLKVVAGGYFPAAVPLERLRAAAERPLAASGRRPDEVAAVLFTSGSTGAPKGAVYTQGMFSAQVGLLRELFSILPGEVSVPTFPLFGLFDAALGMTVVIPEMDATRPAKADPALIIGAVREHRAAQLFGSPALLDALVRWAEPRGETLPSLKRVISAGAPVPVKLVERFTRLLAPEAQLFTPYGATEALPVCLIGSRELLSETAALSAEGKGACVGRPVPGAEVAVIRVSDGPIAAWSEDLRVPGGEVGELAVKGPMVSPRYDALPEPTALSKIRGPRGETIHRMGDLGWQDEKGRLWFCGRKSHRVESALGTLHTIPCEAVFNAHPSVKRTALVGVGPKGSQIPVLCVELEGGADAAKVAGELLDLGSRREHTKAIKTVLFHPAFPVDVRHNAKIFREKLAVWAAEKVR